MQALFCDLPMPQCRTSYKPRHHGGIGEIIKPPSKWSVELSPSDVEAVRGHHADERG
jgi:hypothetical protein